MGKTSWCTQSHIIKIRTANIMDTTFNTWYTCLEPDEITSDFIYTKDVLQYESDISGLDIYKYAVCSLWECNITVIAIVTPSYLLLKL